MKTLCRRLYGAAFPARFVEFPPDNISRTQDGSISMQSYKIRFY